MPFPFLLRHIDAQNGWPANRLLIKRADILLRQFANHRLTLPHCTNYLLQDPLDSEKLCSAKMSGLLDCPKEIVDTIVNQAEPEDITSFAWYFKAIHRILVNDLSKHKKRMEN